MADLRSIQAGVLRDWAAQLLERAGLAPVDAAMVAENLVGANLRGVDTHGVSRMAIYVKRIELGLVARETRVRLVKEAPAFALMDGGNGSGAVVCVQAMRLAMEKARQAGIGVVGVQNSNHNGYLAHYTGMAAEDGLIGVALSNAPANMAPWGGKKPYLGANPLSVAVPAGEERPVILDMATSVVAKGKIILAQKTGKQRIPEGWAIDLEGRPTTDVETALKGTVLPLGGAKGYGLSMLVDIFSGILTGAQFGPHIGDLYRQFDRKQDAGHFFMALRPDLFITLEEFAQRMDQMIREIRSAPRAEGVERIYIPGEIEYETARVREGEGIPLEPEVAAELVELGGRFGLPFPE